jgi:hypothetical protein
MSLKVHFSLMALLLCLAVAPFSASWGKLYKLRHLYRDVEHPSWSERAVFESGVQPSGGSGDHKGLWLIDVRKVDVGIAQALRHYKAEASRLGLRGFRVYELGQWDGIGEAPDNRLSNRPAAEGGFIVISQYVTSDSKF